MTPCPYNRFQQWLYGALCKLIGKVFHQTWIGGYWGTCDTCGSKNKFIMRRVVACIANTDDYIHLLLVDPVLCPGCKKKLQAVRIYKRKMEVTDEFKRMKVSK